ncbi:MAG: ACP synthase [Myxococcaceae bacterium]|nr:ACP synthase [Myxococcaceae bacterium]
MKHPGSLTLRRLHAGEAVGDEVTLHVAACEACSATLASFSSEQQAFEQQISFDRFAAGVERAAREASRPPPQRRWLQPMLALAAGLVVIAGAQLVLSRVEPGSGNRLKGGAAVQVVVAGRGPQRDASEKPHVAEALAAGERVRIGLTPDPWKYAIVVSIDDAGEITPIYVDNGHSLAVGASKDTVWLPESLEFTGAGLEHVVIVLSSSPLSLDQLASALRLAFDDARGDLLKLGSLPLPGQQFHRTFLKP